MSLVMKLFPPLPPLPSLHILLQKGESLTSARVVSAQAFLASCRESGHQGGCGKVGGMHMHLTHGWARGFAVGRWSQM